MRIRLIIIGMAILAYIGLMLFLMSLQGCATPCKTSCPSENVIIKVMPYNILVTIPKGYFSDKKYKGHWIAEEKLKEMIKREDTI